MVEGFIALNPLNKKKFTSERFFKEFLEYFMFKYFSSSQRKKKKKDFQSQRLCSRNKKHRHETEAHFGSLTRSLEMKSLASALVLLKNSSSKVKSTADTLPSVSCLLSPRNGEAPLSLRAGERAFVMQEKLQRGAGGQLLQGRGRIWTYAPAFGTLQRWGARRQTKGGLRRCSTLHQSFSTRQRLITDQLGDAWRGGYGN